MKVQKQTVAGVSPVDERHRKKAPPKSGGIKLDGRIRVGQPTDVCYRYWRDLQNLPIFMGHIASVRPLDERRSHWTIRGPADTTLEWDAEIIEDQPFDRISWRSLKGAQIDNAGSVRFIPSADGYETDVQVILTYNPPLGKLGEALVTLFGEHPQEQIEEDLQHFKEVVEREAEQGQ